jgi:hypothetical protein
VRGSVVGGDSIRRKVAVSISDLVTGIFILPNPTNRTMALGLTEPLTEMNTRKLLGLKGGRTERKTDNLTTICEPIVSKMWEP